MGADAAPAIAPAEVEIGEGMEIQGVIAHSLDSKVFGLCTCGDHKLAVMQGAPRCCGDAPGIEVDGAGTVLQVTDSMSLQQRCVVRCNLPPLQLSAH